MSDQPYEFHPYDRLKVSNDRRAQIHKDMTAVLDTLVAAARGAKDHESARALVSVVLPLVQPAMERYRAAADEAEALYREWFEESNEEMRRLMIEARKLREAAK
jgi:hypothetical protein